jgi:hypothetical protein
MKTYWVSVGTTLRILNLDARWRWDSFTPRPLYSLGTNPRYPLDRRLGGPQSRPCGESNPSRPTRSLVAIPTDVWRILAMALYSDYELDDRGSIYGTNWKCYVHHHVQIVCGACPCSGHWRAPFPEIKCPERKADHSPSSIAEFTNTWSYISAPSILLRGMEIFWELIIHNLLLLFSDMRRKFILYRVNTKFCSVIETTH